MVDIQIIREYIKMSWRNFSNKHGRNALEYEEEIEQLDFNEAHVTDEHRTALQQPDVNQNKLAKQIEKELADKGFKEEYVKSYIKSLKVGEDFESIAGSLIKEIVKSFRYRGEPLKKKDLRKDILISDLSMVKKDAQTKAWLREHIAKIIQYFPDYSSGFNSLLDKVESRAIDAIDIQFSEGDIIGQLNPKLRKDREKLYKYYSGQYKLFNELKVKIKQILDLWDGVEEVMEDVLDEEGVATGEKKGTFKIKSGDRLVEEIEDELRDLRDLHEDMSDDMNYVIKVGLIPYKVVDDTDESSAINMSNLFVLKIRDILKDSPKTMFAEEHAEEDIIAEEEGVFEGEDTEGEKGDNRPQASLSETPHDETEESIKDYIQNVAIIKEVDPLYALAGEKGILKGVYTVKSWQKTLDLIEQQIDNFNLDSGTKNQFFEILEEHKEIEEEAAELDDKEQYYLPLVPAVIDLITKYKTDINVDVDKLEKFHVKLIDTIVSLLETEQQPTEMPHHLEDQDMAPGDFEGKEAIPGKQKSRYQKEFNLWTAAQLGQKGGARSLGDFLDAVMELYDIAEQYYADPVQKLMLPFKEKPEYLQPKTLKSFGSHGIDNVAKVMQGLYIEYWAAVLTPVQLEDINNYREIVKSPPGSRVITDVIKHTTEVLEILEELFPNNVENDLLYFANQINKMARKNENVDLGNEELRSRNIADLVEKYNPDKHKTSYSALMDIINYYSGQFLKNHFMKKETKRFLELHKTIMDRVMLSEQTKILSVHDEIRKMMGKPIYYGDCEINSYDNVNDTITLIKDIHKVELTATDITGIVSECDSLNSIAKKYGTTENVAYHVKALYR